MVNIYYLKKHISSNNFLKESFKIGTIYKSHLLSVGMGNAKSL